MYFLSPTIGVLTGLNCSSNSYWTILSTVTMWDCSDHSEVLKPPQPQALQFREQPLGNFPTFSVSGHYFLWIGSPWANTQTFFFWPLQVLANIQCLPHSKSCHQVKIKKLGLITFWQHQANSQEKLNGSWVIIWFIFQWEIWSTVKGVLL